MEQLADVKTKTSNAIKFLENHYKEVESTVEFFDKRLPALKAVFEEEGREFDYEQELIMLNNVTTWSRQLAFLLFDNQLMTEEKEAEYRALTPLRTVEEALNVIGSDREERMNKILEQKKVIDDEIGTLQIFTAELEGISKEEAEKKQAEYNQRTAAVQG